MTPRKHEQAHCQDEERVRRTLRSNLQYITSWHSLWPTVGHFKAAEEQRAECFEHGGEDLTDAYRGSWALKRSMLQYR